MASAGAGLTTGSGEQLSVDPIVNSITVLGDVIGNSDQEATDFFNLRKAVNEVALTLQAPLITMDCDETTVDGDLNTTGNLQVDGTINGAVFPPAAPTLKAALYYKTSTQNAPNGSTDITFDASAPWSNPEAHINKFDRNWGQRHHFAR